MTITEILASEFSPKSLTRLAIKFSKGLGEQQFAEKTDCYSFIRKEKLKEIRYKKLYTYGKPIG